MPNSNLTDTNLTIRLIEPGDCAAALEVYKPYVQSTAITFEYDVPSLSDFEKKIQTITSEYPWLVALQNDKIIGYAYSSKHRPKTAYEWSPESTIYVAAEAHSKGVGRVLYETLFAILKLQGYFNVFAGVALPNQKSEEFHKALGFEAIGVFKNIGYKLGNWHDTRWFQLTLTKHVDNPPLPVGIAEIQNSSDFKAILQLANQTINQH